MATNPDKTRAMVAAALDTLGGIGEHVEWEKTLAAIYRAMREVEIEKAGPPPLRRSSTPASVAR